MALTDIPTTALIFLLNFAVLFCYDANNNYYVSSLAVYKNRAFLTLPRSSCYNNITFPTLIEAHINYDQQTLTQVKIPIFLKTKNVKLNSSCDVLQDAVSVYTENKSGRIWILDRGSKKCPPKLIVYNLNNNNELYKLTLDDVSKKNLKIVVVDASDKAKPLAFIASEENKIIVFSLADKKWWKVAIFLNNNRKISIKIDRLIPSYIDPIMYFTEDTDDKLYYLNMSDIRQQINKVYAEQIGTKLGLSAGITADVGGGLSYFLTRDYAILRWTENTPLTAENHNVLFQSYEDTPFVPCLFKSPQNDIWAVVNPLPPKECNTLDQHKNFQWPEEIPLIHQRIIKLIKVIKKAQSRKPV